MVDIHLDIETADPDDILALCLLATHPKSNLKSVTVTPGGLDQVGVVKRILHTALGKTHIPIGANGLDDGKSRVSEFHYKWLGKVDKTKPDGSPTEIIGDTLREPNQMLVTGAALKNIGAALDLYADRWFTHWTCQGGFAGDNCIKPEYRLDKFKGRVTCPTFNLNGAPKVALRLFEEAPFKEINMVSKNVCHGMFFGKDDILKVERDIKENGANYHTGLILMLEGMAVYCRENPKGKAVHDVLAAVLAVHPEIAEWVVGKPYRSRGEWGFTPMENSHIKIVAHVSHDNFLRHL